MDPFAPILSQYEDFCLHKGRLEGGMGFFDYMSPSSLHSDITAFAYGIRQTRSCINIRHSPAVSTVRLEENRLDRRFYLKLTAVPFRWKAFVCGISLTVNGTTAYENDSEFFENVNLGWPTVYIPLDASLLVPGENVLRLRQTGGDTALLVSVMDLLSLPGRTVGQQVGYRSAVRLGGSFALSFYTAGTAVQVISAEGCRVCASLTENTETILTLEALHYAPALRLQIGNQTIDARMPEVTDPSDDICLVGTDSDDHRHDDSDETDRIINIFTNTSMGDFWQARPQPTRNFHRLSSLETWQKRIDRLKAFGIRISQADGSGAMPWLDRLCGSHYIGRHFHEAYLFFCAALERSPTMVKELHIDFPSLRASQSFTESRKLFEEALKRMYAGCQDNPGLTSVGSPSLLTVYEARAGFERVTIEPVSNIALLMGAVRGAAPRQWGAHVPTDWYFGEPNDQVKSKKFLLCMQLLYLGGADYIYAENSLFKTNAFSREDWEDEFCTLNRQYQRQFFTYKELNPRQGMLQKDLAVIYGNNEFFLWHHDDRIAELPENNDWDQKLWGKWEDNRHHKLWRSIDAWLPLAGQQHSKRNVLNLDLFSGTPYGAVDVIPWDVDFSGYKGVALLGWNTCTDGFAQKLLDYTVRGGQAFVSRCHFNRTDRCDKPFVYDEAQIRLLMDAATETVPFATDEEGNVAVWQLRISRGTLYYGEYGDYTPTPRRMEVMQSVLRRMGEATAQAVCDNPNIHFTLRVTGDGQRILHAVNVCAAGTGPEAYTLRLRTGETVTGEALPCQINTHIL